jgi:hypothetical protein
MVERKGMTIFNGWALDIETSDAAKEHGKMASEGSCMIRTDLMVYHDDDDDG